MITRKGIAPDVAVAASLRTVRLGNGWSGHERGAKHDDRENLR